MLSFFVPYKIFDNGQVQNQNSSTWQDMSVKNINVNIFRTESLIWDCELTASSIYVPGQLSIRLKLNNIKCENQSHLLRSVIALEDPKQSRQWLRGAIEITVFCHPRKQSSPVSHHKNLLISIQLQPQQLKILVQCNISRYRTWAVRPRLHSTISAIIIYQTLPNLLHSMHFSPLDLDLQNRQSSWEKLQFINMLFCALLFFLRSVHYFFHAVLVCIICLLWCRSGNSGELTQASIGLVVATVVK